MSDLRIKTKVIITEVLNERSYHAKLRNGKSIFAYTQSLDGIPDLKVGDEYSVIMSLCNFDEGRLVPHDLKGAQVLHPIVES
jgi:hypothetical protein